MFERIIVIVDGSETSQYAVGASITIAREDASPLVFCVSIDPALRADGIGGDCFAEIATHMSQQMLDDALGQAAAREAPPATGKILTDDPVHGLVAMARQEGAGLIVLGVKPRIGLLRPFMRSLAQEVLRETMIPLCVVRRPARGRLSRRVLVPIVTDDLSQTAVEFATTLGRNFRSTLLFCVAESAANEGAARVHLERAKAHAAASGVDVAEFVLPERGGIPNAIARSAELHACDSIVMASHMRDGLPNLDESSVTGAVIYSSDVPVIIVRVPEPR